MEIDLYWFQQADIEGSAKTFWDRFQPLYEGVEGYRGLILNIGWTVGCVMEWSGDLNQKITLPRGMGQSGWVEMKGPLTGTTKERRRETDERFAKRQMVPRHGYDAWSYGDVKKLAAALREEAKRRHAGPFKVGMLNYAWRDAYGEVAPWVNKHSEAFQSGPHGPYVFDPGTTLHADPAPHGGYPNGIPEGTPTHSAYAAQWGSLSKAVGLDAIMLRDSFGMPAPYRRSGPWGPLASSPEVIREATANVAALVRETKQANPNALVMMYSNGASAVSDWRSNGLDLESVAKEGYLDIFVDQTWAGAWNEVGLRGNRGNFWNTPMLGWTYQLGAMLVHSAILADTKVRHYPLVETFDAWEPWDVIHTAPERLRWGIWAYSHAAVKTPKGLKLPEGSYISWANQGKRLLEVDDVQFLASNLNAAIADARATTDVFGPTIVYSRSAMKWQADHATADHDIKERVDDEAASVIKWPVPVLSVTRMEWLPQVKSDLFLVQTPSHLEPEQTAYLAGLIKKGQPVAIFGSPADGVDPCLAQLGGLTLGGASVETTSKPRAGTVKEPNQEFAMNVPETFGINTRLTKNEAAKGVRVIYSVEGSPALTLNMSQGKSVVMWDPSDIREMEGFSLGQNFNGQGADYALAAGVLDHVLAPEGKLCATDIDVAQTFNIAAWRTQSGIRLMAANLEDGLRDDADRSRHATLLLPKDWEADWRDGWSDRRVDAAEGRLTLDLPQAASVLLEAPASH